VNDQFAKSVLRKGWRSNKHDEFCAKGLVCDVSTQMDMPLSLSEKRGYFPCIGGNDDFKILECWNNLVEENLERIS